MKKILTFALALMLVLSLAACGGKTDPAPSDGGTTNPGTSQQQPSDTPDESTPSDTPDESKPAETPAEFLALFGLTEDDVKPTDAGDGTLEVAKNNPNYGKVTYVLENKSLKDAAAREEFFKKVLEKTRSLSTDGAVYTTVSSKEAFEFKQDFFTGSHNSATWQYNYGTGYVTFTLQYIEGQLSVTLQK